MDRKNMTREEAVELCGHAIVDMVDALQCEIDGEENGRVRWTAGVVIDRRDGSPDSCLTAVYYSDRDDAQSSIDHYEYE